MTEQSPEIIRISLRERYRDDLFETEVPLNTRISDLGRAFGESQGWQQSPIWSIGRLVVAKYDVRQQSTSKPLPNDQDLDGCNVQNGDTLCVYIEEAERPEQEHAPSLGVSSAADTGPGRSLESTIHFVELYRAFVDADPSERSDLPNWVEPLLYSIQHELRQTNLAKHQVADEQIRTALEEFQLRLVEINTTAGKSDTSPLGREARTLGYNGPARRPMLPDEYISFFAQHYEQLQSNGADQRELISLLRRIKRLLDERNEAIPVPRQRLHIDPADSQGGRKICWLHLSDLHFSQARTKPDPWEISAALRQDLEYLMTKHKLVPDFVFFTGDAGFGDIGQDEDDTIQHQLDQAHRLFEQIYWLYQPNLHRDNFFLIPGNHDINRKQAPPFLIKAINKIARCGSQADRREVEAFGMVAKQDWKSLMSGLTDYCSFLRSRYPYLVRDPSTLLYSEQRMVNGIRVGVAGLNSAWSCGLDGADMHGQVWLGSDWQFDRAHGPLRNSDLRFMLTHHPLSWFVEHERERIDQEATKRFHFWLHGHAEGPVVARPSKSHSHLRLGATTVYSRAQRVSSYNITTLNIDECTLKVWLRKFVNGQWEPHVVENLTDRNGVRRISDFCLGIRSRIRFRPV